ncbi:signal recognition particle protein [Limnochorda pilosa]|uniref:Signal recognition particle protein n=1 Tax=Limnochorda pilosa TaxID=1555112 RepID=A0A0K2SKU2_LIMPI|nr:signal recognition particle protein [Limnochorda pilosa]BAS27474.1 signal recognition particle protein [Limnochorda pilosa]
MAFERLSERLQAVFRQLSGRGKLGERDVDEALREVRRALLEADVHFRVVKEVLERIRARAVGEEVLSSLTPAQQVIRIVRDELTELMGGANQGIAFAPQPPTVILLCGLQGSGKTTTAAKLAFRLKQQGRRPHLVAGDLYRPAAVEQLQVLARQVGVPCHTGGPQAAGDAVEAAAQGVAAATEQGADAVLVDTAGRLQVDAEMMEELRRTRDRVKPHEVLLVLDAMTGQEALNVARAFQEEMELTGLVLTKTDGDARGGAALSARAVTGRPIKFVGTGERVEQLEPFHPDRMASRILGMGDVLTLIERAESAMDQKEAQRLTERIREAHFTLEDFLEQLRQVRKMGPMDEILGMLPGLPGGAGSLKGLQVDERELGRVEAIIQSMTPQERRNPQIIDGSRRRRIARGSGTQVQDVNRLLKQFEQTRTLLRQVAGAPLGAGRKASGGKAARGLGRLFRGRR